MENNHFGLCYVQCKLCKYKNKDQTNTTRNNTSFKPMSNYIKNNKKKRFSKFSKNNKC